jgi:hypothetical protein
MIHSEYVYVRFSSDYPVDSLQIGEEFIELKKHLNFSLGRTYEKRASYIEAKRRI